VYLNRLRDQKIIPPYQSFLENGQIDFEHLIMVGFHGG
jgi:hypothetical protein